MLASIEQIGTARASILRVLDAVDEASPNGRDYYPQGPDALAKAVQGREALGDNLRNLAAELDHMTDPDAPETETSTWRMGTAPITFPTVHLNGSGRESLIADARKVMAAVEDAIERMSWIVPNARDYATMEDTEQARLQHIDRVMVLRHVSAYFHEVAKHCKRT